MFMIKEMPKFERPREKLLNNGVRSLSNIELVALILRSGNSNNSVIELSKIVLSHLENLQDLKEINIHTLMEIPGIKEAKATTLIAAIELGRRLEQVISHDYEITCSYDVYNLMKDIRSFKQEHFYCIYLNTKNRVIKKELLYKGTVDQMVIHPRDVFKNAFLASASAIILVHNHPTGNCSPSTADNTTTNVLEKVAKVMYIDILDHIIIGNNEFYSFKENKKHYL